MTEDNPSSWEVRYLDLRLPSGERFLRWYLHGDNTSAATYPTEAEAIEALRRARRCKTGKRLTDREFAGSFRPFDLI
jgi:hypothetical protein